MPNEPTLMGIDYTSLCTIVYLDLGIMERYNYIIQALIPKNNNVDIKIDLCLHGNISFLTEIFSAVHKYISDTHMFNYLKCLEGLLILLHL